MAKSVTVYSVGEAIQRAEKAADAALRRGRIPASRVAAFAAGYRQAMKDMETAPVVTEGVPPDLVLELLSRATGDRTRAALPQEDQK